MLNTFDKDKTKKVIWTTLSNAHTAYCQDSIEQITTALQTLRKLSDKNCIRIHCSFDKKFGKVSIVQLDDGSQETTLAQIWVTGASGSADSIYVRNFYLSNFELPMFSKIRCSKNSEFQDLEFKVIEFG